jgi:hypothetical protein
MITNSNPAGETDYSAEEAEQVAGLHDWVSGKRSDAPAIKGPIRSKAQNSRGTPPIDPLLNSWFTADHSQADA